MVISLDTCYTVRCVDQWQMKCVCEVGNMWWVYLWRVYVMGIHEDFIVCVEEDYGW
jgi:hypothetical protein